MIELRIVFDPQAFEVVSVSGPLANKTLCYGMLEQARQKVQAFDPAKPGILVAQPGAEVDGGA